MTEISHLEERFHECVRSDNCLELRSIMRRHPSFSPTTWPFSPVEEMNLVQRNLSNDAECLRILKIALQFGADPDYCDSFYPALFEAVLRDGHKAMELLIQYGADLTVQLNNRTILEYALDIKKFKCAMLLLDHGFSHESMGDLAPRIQDAVSSRCTEMVALILDQEAGLANNGAEHYGWQVLQVAVKGNDLDTARLLLQHGANPNTVVQRRQKSTCALEMAIENLSVSMVQLLCQHGAHLQCVNYHALVHAASTMGHLDIIHALVTGSQQSGQLFGSKLSPRAAKSRAKSKRRNKKSRGRHASKNNPKVNASRAGHYHPMGMRGRTAKRKRGGVS